MTHNDFDEFGPTIDKDGMIYRRGKNFRTDGAREADEAVSEMMKRRNGGDPGNALPRHRGPQLGGGRAARHPGEHLKPTTEAFLRGLALGAICGLSFLVAVRAMSVRPAGALE